MNSKRPRLLILSFSDISADARVLKQVNLFAPDYDVTTCGFGVSPDPRVRHLELDSRTSRRAEQVQAIFRRLHWYKAALATEPFVRSARSTLKGQQFEAALVNDPEGVSIAIDLVGSSHTHVDIHEFYPGLHDDSAAWRKLKLPYYEWMLHKFLQRAGSATTVSRQIAARYETEYGIPCGVVHNSLPFQAFAPGEVSDPIRIVHSGGAQANRRIEVMMEAVAKSSANVILDLYLTGEKGDYAATLRELADRLGSRVTVFPPLPYSDLLARLNEYDIGIHILPPTNTNNVLALPNKLFDYIQARIGVVVGDTEAMADPVREFEIGAVTSGFDVDDVVQTLDGLTRERVSTWKTNVHSAAESLSVDQQLPVWANAVASRAG